jgi:hypothetical protein
MREMQSEALWDHAACLNVLMRYGRAIDWLDLAALERVFWPDATIDLGYFKGSGADAPGFLVPHAASMRRRCHITTNTVLDVAGDNASADSCALTFSLVAGADGACSAHRFTGRYLDRLSRRAGEWRLAARTYLLHSAIMEPYAGDPDVPGLANTDGMSPAHPYFRGPA